jgi:glutamyl-tRNA reductase
MNEIGILGLSVHDQDAEALARWTIARSERPRRLPELRRALGVDELLYVATCNRVELLFRRSAGVPAADLRQRAAAALDAGDGATLLRTWSGEAAVEHLFLVAAGLESAQLGEREIRAQLRDALAVAREVGAAHGALEALVEEALRVARQVHLRTHLGRGRESLADIAAELVLERVRRTPSPVALVGVSPMTRRCAEILLREPVPVVLVNRTPAHAEQMVGELAALAQSTPAVIHTQSLDGFRRRPPRVEAVICATGAAGVVLARPALERLAARTASQEPPLVVDLAVPPDVDPLAAAAVEIQRIGMDEINGTALARREALAAEAAAARRWVAEALADLRRRLAERALAPVIRQINARFRETALEGVERLLRKQGLAPDVAAREEIERWAETLARRFAHLPTLGLRGLAADHGVLAVRSFLDAGDPELFAAFGDVAEELERLAPPTAAAEPATASRPARPRRRS